ncbi:MAG: hypothetical protein ABI867_00265 [Kofleriaceae bacterium]
MKALTILFASLTACAMDSTGTTGPGGDGDDGGGGDGGGEVPVSVDGTYRVYSQYDLTVEAVLPEPAYETVVALRDFSTDPGETLLDLAEAAGVPGVATLRDALPSVLESKLEGFIDDQIPGEVTQLAADLAALGEIALTEFAIDSELVIDGDRATHRLTAIELSALDQTLALDALPASVTTQTATAELAGTRLTVGDHAYGLPFGEYAWRALETACEAQFGAKPRALLGARVNCPAVAAAVATKCVLGQCIGHRTELTAICERGLDEVVGIVQRKIEAIRFDAIHLGRGTATATGTRLDDGVWTAEINAGQGLRHVPATFTAAR